MVPVALSSVCPKAVVPFVVDSLFIIAPIVGVLCLFLVLLCNALCPFQFCNHLDEEREMVVLL